MNLRLGGFKLLLMVPFCVAPCQSQSARMGNLSTHVDSLIAAMPSSTGGGQYKSPSATQQSDWKTMVESILKGDMNTAVAMAAGLGYQVVEFTDSAVVPYMTHAVVEKTAASSNHWGTYIFNRSPRRSKLVIQSPHPLNDSKTGAQGFSVYQTVSARAFFVSGAHRCNSPLYSTCSGTTTSCSSTDEPYRMSDQPHVVDGMFQISTEAFLGLVDSCIFLQPHGFAKLATDPDIIMSNGTQKAPPSGSDHLLRLRDNLSTIDPTLTFKVAHVDTTWTRLIATTNTQGRRINGSTAPCTASATSASGRFLHLEQKYTGLRDTKQNWNKLAQAVALTFPETPTGVASERPPDFALFHNYPNPFNGTTTIVYTLTTDAAGTVQTLSPRTTLTVYDLLGRAVTTFPEAPGWPGQHRLMFDAAGLPSGTYYAVLQTPVSIRVIPMLLLR